ncbi:MAG: helix-turn-helix domain-containing protein [Bacteroidia bacterium]
MTQTYVSQQQFFQELKDLLPAHVSMVDEIGELLGISYDSAYRRIRGEKELSFSELQKIVAKYNLSPGHVLQQQTQGHEIVFQYNPLNSQTFNMYDYLVSAWQAIKGISGIPDAELIYAAKDIPVFHYFLVDEVGWFKMFVWQKTLIGFPEFENQKFSLKRPDERIMDAGKKLLYEYLNFPSTELWNEETIYSYLKQVEFYCEADLFEDKEDAFIILDKLEEYLDHLKKMAANGQKFLVGKEPGGNSENFKLYHNEVVRSDNTILARVGDKKVTFLTHSAMNFLRTTDVRFCETTHQWLTHLIKRSSLISTVSEKHRNQFFAKLHDQVKHSRERVRYLLK